MSVVSAPHTGQHGVAETHLGDLGTDSGLGQQRPGRPAQVVQPPARDAAGRVEGFLALVEAKERARAVGAENMIATRSSGIAAMIFCAAALNGINTSRLLLYLAGGNGPDLAVRRQFTAPQASPLAAPRCRQQQEPHEAAERSLVLLSREPDAPQFVVCEGSLARPLRDGCGPAATGTSGDTKSLRAACQVSRVRSARQHTVAAHRAVVIGDVIEHAGVLAALDLGDRQPSQRAAAEQFRDRPRAG